MADAGHKGGGQVANALCECLEFLLSHFPWEGEEGTWLIVRRSFYSNSAIVLVVDSSDQCIARST